MSLGLKSDDVSLNGICEIGEESAHYLMTVMGSESILQSMCLIMPSRQNKGEGKNYCGSHSFHESGKETTFV